MKIISISTIRVALVLGLLAAMGCSKEIARQEPLPLDQVPSSIKNVFQKAKPELKALADQVVSALEAKEYQKALTDLEGLQAAQGLSKEQISVASRSTVSLVAAVQAAAEQEGNKKAEQFLQHRRETK